MPVHRAMFRLGISAAPNQSTNWTVTSPQLQWNNVSLVVQTHSTLWSHSLHLEGNRLLTTGNKMQSKGSTVHSDCSTPWTQRYVTRRTGGTAPANHKASQTSTKASGSRGCPYPRAPHHSPKNSSFSGLLTLFLLCSQYTVFLKLLNMQKLCSMCI